MDDAKVVATYPSPQGWRGRLMLGMMNRGHAPLSRWGLSLLSPDKDAHVLDVGCGGGANIARLLRRCPDGGGGWLGCVSGERGVQQKEEPAGVGPLQHHPG
ncbi:MAG: class I SAM-dependent methyltransferase [Sphaerochaeta sp.]|nr:class I SAM-dependent methyltransferase [Sphaerochaeta sp.]